MTSAFLSRRLALVATLATSLFIAACGGNDNNDTGTTSIRTLNLSNDLSSVDLFVDGTRRFEAQASDALSGYLGLTSATYTLAVKRAGDGASLFTGAFALSKDQHYTAVVWGRETALRLFALPEDEDGSSIASGNTRLRFVNATMDTGAANTTPDPGALDVYLTTPTANLVDSAATQRSVPSTGLPAGFRDLSAGTYRLRVTGAGDPNDVRLDVPALTLGAQKVATLVLTAGAGGVLVDGTLIEQQATTITSMRNTQARVRMVASMGSAGVVGVSIGGRTLAGGLRSPSAGPYTLVDAGAPTTEVRINGSVLQSQARSFAAGSDYTLLVYGAAGAGQVAQIADDNRLPAISTRAKVRMVNGTTGQDPLTLSIDSLALVSDLAGGSVSSYASATSGSSLAVDVTSPSSAAALFSSTAFNLKGQAVYTVFMLDGNASPQGVIRQDR